MNKKLIEVIESLNTSNIPEDRKVILKKLIDYIQKKIELQKSNGLLELFSFLKE